MAATCRRRAAAPRCSSSSRRTSRRTRKRSPRTSAGSRRCPRSPRRRSTTRRPGAAGDRCSRQRLLVAVAGLRPALGVDERRRVVAHELTHAALAGATSGRTPAWLVEGIALYVSGDQRAGRGGRRCCSGAPARGRRRSSARPSGRSRWRARAPNAIDAAGGRPAAPWRYAYASAAALRDRRQHGGRRALLRLYDAFGDPRLPGRPAAGSTLTSRRAAPSR